jgi:galactokinase
MRAQAIASFGATFGIPPRVAASAPGRVNLIGEHTDYNGGPVLPIAIAMRTIVAAGPAPDGLLEYVSTGDGSVGRVAWREQIPRGSGGYLVGVMRELHAAGVPIAGARLAIAGDIPIGAGLASSGALTVATALALARLGNSRLSRLAVASVAFRAEHDHVGVRCGMMDQMIAAFGRARQALWLECATLAAHQVPFQAPLLLVDTGVRHALAASAFNQRRAECDAALARLRRAQPDLPALAAWPERRQHELRDLPDPLRQRVQHVVGETTRTRAAARALSRGRLREVGRLLYASHESCRRLYDCSAPELDLIVRAARRAGALGARLTGAGWGGSVIALLGKRDGGRGTGGSVAAAIARAFLRRFGHEPDMRMVSASPGARPERV